MFSNSLDAYRRVFVATLLTGSAITAPLYAQEQAAPAAAPAASEAAATDATDSSGGIEEIVVTAQKRAENLQDVPISISAVTGEAVDRFHVTNVAALTGSIPNITFTNRGNIQSTATLVIRGIGINEGDPFAGTAVGIVIDDVVQGSNVTALSDFFDVERIEVLRGPQGTLFGANTTGGVINVVTKQPTGEYGVEGRVTLGNYHRLEGAAAFNFPISDTVAGKISVIHKGRDGYYDNTAPEGPETVGSQDVTITRAYLKYDAGTGFDATATLQYDRVRNGATPIVNTSRPGASLYVPGQFTTVKDFDFDVGSQVPDESNIDQYSATLKMNWDTSFGEVTSITNYTDSTFDYWADYDGTPLFLLHGPRYYDAWQFSQELRNTINPSDSLQVLFGAFYQKKKYSIDLISLTQAAAPGLRILGVQAQENYSLSGFSQAYWHITDRLELQAGLRLTYEETEATAGQRTFRLPGTVSLLTGGTLISQLDGAGKENWTQLGGKVGLNYRPNDDLTLYGYYARGFKSGGFNGRINTPAAIGPFDPETVDTAEIGFKSDLLDRRLRLNVSAFYNWYDDKQVPQVRFIGIIAASTVENAASVTSKGIEVELEAAPTDGLRLTGSFGYLDAKFDTFVLGATDFSGRQTPYSPKYTYSLGANYTFPVGPGESSVALQYNHSAKNWADYTQLVGERLPSFGLLNASLDWKPTDGRWSVSLWARNLTDERYLVSAKNAAPTFSYASFGAPREYGVDFKFEF